jgi:predicted acetyltransferase
MRLISKKTIATFVAGTFLIVGAVSPFIVQASTSDDKCATTRHHQVSPEKNASRIAETFGISQADILKYQAQGMNFREINHAAFLAKVSNKTLDEVIAVKTTDNTWKDVAAALGITKEQMKATRQDMTATRLNKQLGMDKQVTINLLQQGYHARDIATANELAKNTGKSIEDVLSMKKINNSWRDVANQLGVDDNTFKQDRQELQQAFPHHHRG